jgi:putative ABC transport system permease protein
MNLAIKDIRHNVGRFVLTAVGIGLLLMVVMGMGGIYRGMSEDAILLVERLGADLWVVQRDTRGPFAELSRVPPSLQFRVRAVPGVEEAREFVYHTIQRERDGKPLRIALLGMSWPEDRGEWIPLDRGRPLRANHYELIADRTLGLTLGEQLRLGKDVYTVVGVSRDMISSGGDGIGFVTVTDAQAIQFDSPGEAIRLERAARQARTSQAEIGIEQPGMIEFVGGSTSAELPSIARIPISAVLVHVAPGVPADRVKRIIEGWSDVTVYSRDEQEGFLLRGIVEKSLRQIGLFRVLLSIIATIIMGLILYTLTLDKLHSIALLKLIGTPDRVILGLVLQQALVLGTAGFLFAYGLGLRLFPMFPRRVLLVRQDLIWLAVVVLLISVLASLFGIWKAIRVSPGEALN